MYAMIHAFHVIDITCCYWLVHAVTLFHVGDITCCNWFVVGWVMGVVKCLTVLHGVSTF